jgi:hypothetical protein
MLVSFISIRLMKKKSISNQLKLDDSNQAVLFSSIRRQTNNQYFIIHKILMILMNCITDK